MRDWLEKNWLPTLIITFVAICAPQVGVAILAFLGIKWLIRNG